LLHKYVVSRLYSTSFKEVAQVVTKDTVFVPSGWDSLAKINLLTENIPLKEEDDERALFNSLIQKPLVQKVCLPVMDSCLLVIQLRVS